MKLQKTTLILLLVALGLGGVVYFLENDGGNKTEETAKKQQIFTFTADDVQSLTIKKPDLTLIVERGNPSENIKWFLKSPTQTPASDAAVSYLMDLLVKGNSDRILTTPANQLQEYGLNPPQATIEVKLKNQKTHQLILGNPDFNRRFIYAQADPPANLQGNINVLLISTDFENAINRELSEWKQSSENSVNPKAQPTP